MTVIPGWNKGIPSKRFEEKLAKFRAGEPLECKRHGLHTAWRLKGADRTNARKFMCRKCQWESNRRAAASPESRFTFLLMHARKRARKCGWDYDIDVLFLKELMIKQGMRCALSGVSFDNDKYKCSIDRRDSKKGYTRDNVQLVLKIINTMKWDIPQPKFVWLCQSVVDFQREKSGGDGPCL